jgi:hypothetical protein
MISSSQLEWHRLISKEGRGIDDVDFGEVREVHSDCVITESKISDSIPDGNANRRIGRVVAVVIRETNKGFGASEVISHVAPTSYIAAPTYEKRAAIHNVLSVEKDERAYQETVLL